MLKPTQKHIMETKTTYAKKLLDPRWQKKRLEVLQRDNWTCQICLDKKTTLHVHHKRYTKNKNPWEYDLSLLVTLCKDCHEEESEKIKNDQMKFKMTDAFLFAGFFMSELPSFCASVWCCKLQERPGLVLDAYGYAFENPEIQKYILDKYIQDHFQELELDQEKYDFKPNSID